MAVLSLDDTDASDEMDVVDIFEAYVDDESWLIPWVAEESVISEDVEEEDDNGRGYKDPFSCNLMCCSKAGLSTPIVEGVWMDSKNKSRMELNVYLI